MLFSSTFSSLVASSGIDQYDRDSIINDFKNGACRLMVATSVAARGLDVKQLILVINYSCPNHYEDYIHRAGRTGRAGNKVSCFKWDQMVSFCVFYQPHANFYPFGFWSALQGYAYTFITEEQARYAGDIIKALELSGSPVPHELEQLWASFKDQQKAVKREFSQPQNLTTWKVAFDGNGKNTILILKFHLDQNIKTVASEIIIFIIY